MKIKEEINMNKEKKDIIERSDELDDKLAKMPNSLDKTVADLIKSGKRVKVLVNWVIVSIVVEFFLLIALTGIYTRSQVQQESIRTNQQALVTSCESGNEFRKNNLVLWQYIISLPRTAEQGPRTPEQQKVIDDFEVFLNDTFKLRDCSQINADS